MSRDPFGIEDEETPPPRQAVAPRETPVTRGPDKKAEPTTAQAAPEHGLPPHDMDAERGVLGGIMLDFPRLWEVAAVIGPDDFYLDCHAIIFRAMQSIGEKTPGLSGADTVMVAAALAKDGTLEEIGGPSYLAEIIGTVPHSAHAVHYAGVVKEKSIRRRALAAAIDLQTCARRETDDIESMTLAVAQIANELTNELALPDLESVGDIAAAQIIAINERIRADTAALIDTGFYDLDKILSGISDEDLIIIAARPSMGKTSLAVQIATEIVRRFSQDVLFFSLEQGRGQLVERELASMCGIDLSKIRNAKSLTADECSQLVEAAADLQESKLYIDDGESRSVAKITAIVRRRAMKHKVKAVFIDYLQLITPSGKKADNREQQVAEMTRGLKRLARSMKLPVFCLAQLNRQIEQRPDKSPRLSDLRESGAIEQDADIVMFLHRPDFYEPETRPGEADVTIAKHRSGQTGKATLLFEKQFVRFRNFARDMTPDPFGPANGNPYRDALDEVANVQRAK